MDAQSLWFYYFILLSIQIQHLQGKSMTVNINASFGLDKPVFTVMSQVFSYLSITGKPGNHPRKTP